MIKKYSGCCHCKRVKFQFLSYTNVDILKCNCSICSMTEYQHLIIKHINFKLIKGKKCLIPYSFNTKKASHLFCKVCGIKSFYQPRSHPDSYSINYKCIKDPPKVRKIIFFNGKNFKQALKELNK